MSETLLIVHFAATTAMVGLIWFVQIVHYPLFGSVGSSSFAAYEREHQNRTTIVVLPLMLTEAVTALLLLWFLPPSLPWELAATGFLLVLALWASTFFWQVPVHSKLSKSYDAQVHQQLVTSNWIRTAAWSMRGVIAAWLCLLCMN